MEGSISMAQITLGDLGSNKDFLNQFIQENTRPTIQYCVRKFRNINEEDAKDLVQDALLKLIEIVTQENIQNTSAPATSWMYQELRWRCTDLTRKKEPEEEKVIYMFPSPTYIEEEVIQREIHQFLRKCIQTRMRRRRREIFELYLEGYIAAEIARKLCVTPAFVSKETKIGCRLLRKWLEQRGFD